MNSRVSWLRGWLLCVLDTVVCCFSCSPLFNRDLHASTNAGVYEKIWAQKNACQSTDKTWSCLRVLFAFVHACVRTFRVYVRVCACVRMFACSFGDFCVLDVYAFMQALLGCENLKRIDLRHNELGDASCTHLAEALSDRYSL